MKKTCQITGQEFEISDKDLEFYQKIQSPPPTICPEERQRLRLSFRNERSLYHRKCDKTGKQIISMYHSDCPLVVYDQQEWWSDNWNAFDYGRNFDFNKTFFEQFADLQKVVPRMSMNNLQCENSEFTNFGYNNKNCYLIYTSDVNENCLYGRWVMNSFKCLDCDFTNKSEFCYDSIDIIQCNRAIGSQQCKGSSNIYFCYNLVNCHNCFGCSNLRNKSYCIFNEQKTKEEYDRMIKELNIGSYRNYQATRALCQTFIAGTAHKALNIVNCENSVGDYLSECKNAFMCFDCMQLEDCAYSSNLQDQMRDCYDWDFAGIKGELCYQAISSATGLFDCQFIANCWLNCSNIEYSELCVSSSNLFGCIGLRKANNCIFNKQYSKEEFAKLKQKITEHMKKTGEYGQFFPNQFSPFAYNETVAQDYLPLSKEEVLARGFRWRDKDKTVGYRGPVIKIPDDIKDCPNNIGNQVLTCTKSKHPYKVIKEELEFLRENSLPIPRFCVEERYLDRMKRRNPRTLYSRNCDKCQKSIQSTYSPKRTELIYCENCYLNNVYQN